MVSVDAVIAIITERLRASNRALKAQFDAERDGYAVANANTIRVELISLFERTRGMVEQAASNHQAQLDHVNLVNVEQEACINAEHTENTTIMAQLAEQKVSLDGTTELFCSRDEEIRASILGREVDLLQLFHRSIANLQKTISVGRVESQQFQQQLQALVLKKVSKVSSAPSRLSSK